MRRREEQELLDLFAFDSGWPVDLRQDLPPDTRSAPQSPRSPLLAMAGMAAILTGAGLLLADPLGAAVAERRATSLGPIDQVVHVETSAAAELEAHETFDGVLPIRTGTVAARVSGQTRTVELLRLLVVDGDEATAFGDDPAAAGMMQLCGLGPSQVAVRADLANDLDVLPGDRLEVTLEGHRLDLMVAEVVPAIGVAAFGDLAVAPSALEAGGVSDAATRPLVLVSNIGDVVAGATHSDTAVAAITDTLGEDVRIDRVKHELVADARRWALLTAVAVGLGTGVLAALGWAARRRLLRPSGRSRPLPTGGSATS